MSVCICLYHVVNFSVEGLSEDDKVKEMAHHDHSNKSLIVLCNLGVACVMLGTAGIGISVAYGFKVFYMSLLLLSFGISLASYSMYARKG
jgi:hypothetical protein